MELCALFKISPENSVSGNVMGHLRAGFEIKWIFLRNLDAKLTEHKSGVENKSRNLFWFFNFVSTLGWLIVENTFKRFNHITPSTSNKQNCTCMQMGKFWNGIESRKKLFRFKFIIHFSCYWILLLLSLFFWNFPFSSIFKYISVFEPTKEKKYSNWIENSNQMITNKVDSENLEINGEIGWWHC